MSAYKTKIQKALAQYSIAIDNIALAKFRIKGEIGYTIRGGDEWLPIGLKYSAGEKCELCGHDPIKRVFIIKSKTSGKELRIGSECARNYLDENIITGLTKLFQLDYNKIVNPIKFEEESEILQWAADNKVYIPYSYVRQKNLIGSGYPSDILKKIKEGKAIGKREKEVMTTFKFIKDNYEEFQVVSEWKKVEEEQRNLKNYAVYCSENFIHLLNVIAHLHDETAKYFDMFFQYAATTKERESVKSLFDNLYSLNLSDKDKYFVNGCYGFYKNNRISEKQIAALQKLNGRVTV